MRLIKHEFPVDIDPGATCPNITADEYDLVVTFNLLRSNDRGKFKFVSVTQFTFGYPNEEAISGHRYYKLGLLPFEFVEVEGSEIIQSIKEANRVHPRHLDSMYDSTNHYVIAFHDSTLEVICDHYMFY